MRFTVQPITTSDKEWVSEIVLGWGAEFIVSRGRKIFPQNLPGFIAFDSDEKKIGLITYEIISDQCEVVTLDAFVKFSGVGTELLDAVSQLCKTSRIRRLWLITLNDNLDAIRFYQRRGMTIVAVHVNAVEISRKIKPTIPLVGQHGIPLRDEIEFEMIFS